MYIYLQGAMLSGQEQADVIIEFNDEKKKK